MKHILIISFLFLLANNSFSQDYLDKVVNESCKCLEKISDTIEIDQSHMEMGICMIEASMPFKKKIKKDYDIDLDNFDGDEGEKLGRLIGLKMAGVCPKALIKMTLNADEENAQDENIKSSHGVITKYEDDLFVSFSLKSESGKTTKFYWLTFFESAFDLTDSYTTLVGKSVTIDYEVSEFYDPKIGEYRQFFIIKKLY